MAEVFRALGVSPGDVETYDRRLDDIDRGLVH